jgi:hypothetical protein
MAALIELKYFNTFWLKKIKKITDVEPTLISGVTPQVDSYDAGTRTITMNTAQSATDMNVGQETTIIWGSPAVIYRSYIVSRNALGTQFVLGTDPPSAPSLPQNVVLGKIINFDNIPQGYPVSITDADDDWLIEESRIRGGYNNVSVDFGVKAYLVEDEPNQLHRSSSLIHSGIFNSRTGINQTNQFSVAEDITRTIDPANDMQKILT